MQFSGNSSSCFFRGIPFCVLLGGPTVGLMSCGWVQGEARFVFVLRGAGDAMLWCWWVECEVPIVFVLKGAGDAMLRCTAYTHAHERVEARNACCLFYYTAIR